LFRKLDNGNFLNVLTGREEKDSRRMRSRRWLRDDPGLLHHYSDENWIAIKKTQLQNQNNGNSTSIYSNDEKKGI